MCIVLVQNAKGCANVFLCMCLWAYKASFLDGSIVGERRGRSNFTKKNPFRIECQISTYCTAADSILKGGGGISSHYSGWVKVGGMEYHVLSPP